jgi:hypothetical protein
LSFKAQLPLRVATHPAGSVIALNGATRRWPRWRT